MEHAAHRLMTRPIRHILVLGTALAGFGWALPAALAESVTYDNNTEVAYYNGTSPQAAERRCLLGQHAVQRRNRR